jgi:hypothetical protein
MPFLIATLFKGRNLPAVKVKRVDPPKSPLKRLTLKGFPPFSRGARGDEN